MVVKNFFLFFFFSVAGLLKSNDEDTSIALCSSICRFCLTLVKLYIFHFTAATPKPKIS